MSLKTQGGIIPLSDAPVVVCLVKLDRVVVWSGDSSYEANKEYKRLRDEGKNPKFVKNVQRPAPSSKPMDFYVKNPDYVKDLFKFLPKRIVNVYATMLAGKQVLPAELEEAIIYHPEYFQVGIINKNTSNEKF